MLFTRLETAVAFCGICLPAQVRPQDRDNGTNTIPNHQFKSTAKDHDAFAHNPSLTRKDKTSSRQRVVALGGSSKERKDHKRAAS
jgi:hypothetical protein